MDSMPFLLTLTGIGLVCSFLSGLLGVGGSAFIIPTLLFVPPLLGTGHLDIKQAASLSMTLILVGSFSGALVHLRGKAATGLLTAKLLAPACAIGALIGGLMSGLAPNWLMTGTFATLAFVGGIMMFYPRPLSGDELMPGTVVTFNRPLGIAIAASVGLVSGLVGAGGAFILVPLMIYVLGIPTRVTIAASLGIVFLSAAAGFAGKVMVGQVVFVTAIFVAAGAVPGARYGAWVSKRIEARRLRYGLAFLSTAMAAMLWWDLIART